MSASLPGLTRDELETPAAVGAPKLCQNCTWSTRHKRQKDGETPLFVKCCQAFMCAGCRKHRKCQRPSEPTPEARARYDLQLAVPANDGWYAQVSESVYHADRASLSSSGARSLLAPSCPAIFRQNQLEPPKPKPQYDFGHAAHKMVLGEGAQIFVMDPAVHGRTKDGSLAANPKATTKWKAAEQHARAQGKSCITKDQMEIAQTMAGRVHAHPIAGRLFQSGVAEYSGYWHDDETGVRCRFRPDFLPDTPGRRVCVDYKTAKSANPAKFRKDAFDYGYHQQAAWYLDGLRETQIADDAAFLFVVQQKEPPFVVSVVQFEPEDIELGRQLNRRAIDIYAECVASNRWPGYGDGIHTIGLSLWARKQIEETLTEGNEE